MIKDITADAVIERLRQSGYFDAATHCQSFIDNITEILNEFITTEPSPLRQHFLGALLAINNQLNPDMTRDEKLSIYYALRVLCCGFRELESRRMLSDLADRPKL